MFTFGKPKIPEVDVEVVKRSLDANENVVLLDVRTVGEFERAKIAKSINLPIQDIPVDIAAVVPNKAQKIYVYCLSGSRSSLVVEEMMKMGYTDVYSVTNGLLAWRAHQYPTV